MPIRESAVPLLAVEAVVLDFETTGLDPRSDRIVEIGAVRIGKGGILPANRLSMRVNPGVPIPTSASEIHGIDDLMVENAPDPGKALERLQDYLENDLIVGHSIGFDLAVLRSELIRLGRSYEPPRTLDTRLLAQIALPSLPDFSIEVVGERLGVSVSGRHSALGDVETTAAIYYGLVPHLRERGIRSVAEAVTACRGLTESMERQAQAGWEEPTLGPAGRIARVIDPYPYRHRVFEVMASPPKFAGADFTLMEAAQRLDADKISSAFVKLANGTLGIITERDVLRAIVKSGGDALVQSIEPHLSQPLQTIEADALIYRALARMDRLRVRHLGVIDESGELVGALSARDLLKLRASQAIRLGDAIDEAESAAELAAIWADLPAVAESLVAEDIDSRDIAALISQELRAITRRAALMAEEQLAAEGAGDPPCAYSVLVLGSAGRGESLLAMDQDNAIIFEKGEPDGDADRYFARIGDIMNEILHEVGVPLCKGGVMARNPQWRGSEETWAERVEAWVSRSKPQDLLSVDIFFDMIAVHGDLAMAERLFAHCYETGSKSGAFAKQLAQANADFAVPLGLFGQIRTESGRVDLQAGALFPIVSTARILAIRHNIPVRSTRDRLHALVESGIGGARDLRSAEHAHRTVLQRVLEQQILDIREGLQPSNRVVLKALSSREIDALKDSLGSLRHLDRLVRDLLF